MKFFNTAARTALLATVLGVSGVALTVSALAADSAPAAKASPADRKAEMEQRRQEFFKHMADRMADRLEIKASQQAAWQSYITTLQSAMTPPAHMPEHPKTDAAGIARFNADMAAEHAKRLATIADATAKFQEVLTPEQRKTFDQMAAAFEHRHHGMHHGFGGRDGGHGGWGRDGHDGGDGHHGGGWAPGQGGPDGGPHKQ